MAGKTDILIELEEIAPRLASKKIPHPYLVPEGYFTLFAEGMLDKINLAKNPLTVPEGYFEGFAEQMLMRVRGNEVAEELKEIAPFLNELSKQMPFYLPAGYFENLEINKNQVKPGTPARVVSLFGSNLKKWAAAAAIIFTIGLGWMFFSKQSADPISVASLSQYEMDSLLNQVEAGKLDGLLEQEGTDSEFTGLLLAAQEGVEKSVQTLSTEELNGYLENYTIPEPGS